MAKNILICDDAAFMRMMIKDILTKNGYNVVGEAENGLKAVEKYTETKPDLVLMDITMPEMDGIQALKKIKELVSFCYGNDVVRYVFFGGCTTLVNLVCFYILWNLCHLNLNIANVISIIVAIIFAYIVNSKYVFQDKCETLRDHIRPFCKFISARILTMVIEVGGVWLLCEKMGMNGMVGKFCTQFIVLALNYVFSKFFVFTTGKK